MTPFGSHEQRRRRRRRRQRSRPRREIQGWCRENEWQSNDRVTQWIGENRCSRDCWMWSTSQNYTCHTHTHQLSTHSTTWKPAMTFLTSTHLSCPASQKPFAALHLFTLKPSLQHSMSAGAGRLLRSSGKFTCPEPLTKNGWVTGRTLLSVLVCGTCYQSQYLFNLLLKAYLFN